MAHLDQVVGALLRDVARARALADRFSRDLSEVYEDDPILRLFPVPRVEIKQATIDLRLAVTKVGIEAGEGKDHDQTDRVLRKAAELLLTTFATTVLSTKPEPPEEVIAAIRHPRFRKGAELAVLQAIQKLAPDLMNAAPTRRDYEELAMKVANMLFHVARKPDSVISEFIEKHPELEKEVIGVSAKQLAVLVSEMGAAQQAQDKLALNQQLEIEVESPKIAQFPESAISTLHLDLGVRNYNWTKVGENDLESARRLAPE